MQINGIRQHFYTLYYWQQNGIFELFVPTRKEQCAHRHRFQTQ
jgi:putative transposase